MVKVEELRIGNIVYGVSDRIEKITYLTEKNLKTNLLKLDAESQLLEHKDINFIPITREHLEKANFNFKQLGFNDLSVSYGLTSGDIHFVIGNYYHKLEYLHELQNMYYDFTKKELTFKD
jgi:hypothetical protein